MILPFGGRYCATSATSRPGWLTRSVVGWPWRGGETEPCINAQVATAGAYFGVEVKALVLRLVGEQFGDGGWNCDAWAGSTRSLFNTTICVLEALVAYERAFGGRPDRM